MLIARDWFSKLTANCYVITVIKGVFRRCQTSVMEPFQKIFNDF